MSWSRFCLSLAACGVAAGLIAVGGCAQTPPGSNTISQKQASGQSPYTPYYQGAGQNSAAGPRPPNYQPVKSWPPAPPVPGQPPATGGGIMPQAVQAQGKVRVAILLPLSGRNAALGQAMLNAAQQAVFDAAGANFELQPHDTAAEGGAAEAARAAVAGGSQLIIGPLFASDIPLVMPVAQNAGLEMLPLSTDTSLAERGVYIMGLAPGAQVERVVSYAAAHGARHFAALIPATPYGSLVGLVFQAAVSQAGGDVVDYETYDASSATDAADRAKRLGMQRDHIDALFLPEADANLKTAADQLTAAGFDPAHTHILGTGLWDEPGLGRLSPLLAGGWYAAPDPAPRANFIAGYQAAYGKEPPRLATLAYDATALAAVLAKRGGHYDEAALTNPNGFAGLDGIFRLTPSGSVERALAVNEVTPDGARVIDAAPVSFIGRNR